MSNKEDILSKFRKNIIKKYDMPRLDDIKGITYPDPLVQFISMTENVGGKVVELEKGQDINRDNHRHSQPRHGGIASGTQWH